MAPKTPAPAAASTEEAGGALSCLPQKREETEQREEDSLRHQNQLKQREILGDNSIVRRIHPHQQQVEILSTFTLLVTSGVTE